MIAEAKHQPIPSRPSKRFFRSGLINEAIRAAINEGMHIAELECLGLEDRTVNALEASDIRLVEELVQQTPASLQGIEGIGPGGIRQIIEAIEQLPELAERREEYLNDLEPNRADVDRIRAAYGLERAGIQSQAASKFR